MSQENVLQRDALNTYLLALYPPPNPTFFHTHDPQETFTASTIISVYVNQSVGNEVRATCFIYINKKKNPRCTH